jgi:hypothetical protein
MSSFIVEIINPKAEKLLKDLESMNLIVMKKTKKSRFPELLEKMRSKHNQAPDLAEIAREVEVVRAQRHGPK